LQALTALNEPVFMDCARALARRTLSEGGSSDAARVQYAFRCCVARSPSEREIEVVLALVDKELVRFAKGESDPWELAGVDPEHVPALPDGVSVARLAAWTAAARVLLNLDETITRE
jgi:hypothetical protein